MSEKAPILVTLYSWRSGEPVPIAEFHLKPDGRVELTVIDPREHLVAHEFYDHGVDVFSEGRTVRPHEGRAFMRALLQPFRMSYYRFVDESARAESRE